MTSFTALSLLFSIALGTLYFISKHLGIQVDAREPPFVPARIPYIGHAIGLLRHGSRYWVGVSAQCNFPIYTVGLLKKKFYIITSLELLSSVQRNSKTLSFLPFLTLTAEKLSEIAPEHVKFFPAHEGNEGLAFKTIEATESSLRQKDVEDLSVSMLECLKSIMDDLLDEGSRCFKLHGWIRHAVTQGATRAIYGCHNPFNQQSVEDAFWIFEENASILLNGFLPRSAGLKGLTARDIVAEEFTKYYKSGYQNQASALAHNKWQAPAQFGFDEKIIAQIEVPFLIGVLNNTIPTVFWTLCQILSNPEILSSLRSELAGAIHSSNIPATQRHTINLGYLKKSCPLLLSVYHETLRKRTSFSSARFVTSDTLITDGTNTYLLKAGSILQIPVEVFHANKTYWGSDATDNDAHRFLDPSRKKRHPLAFRSFGGAPFICPGRQFATTEVMALLAMLIIRFEISPVSGAWNLPKQKVSMFGSIPPPATDIEVRFREREGGEGLWDYDLGEAGLLWPLESG